MACFFGLVDSSYGSASEHEESEGEQDFPFQGQAASTEQAAPCVQDASQSRDDHDPGSERCQHNQDEEQTATTRDSPVPVCVASVHGEDSNLIPKLPTRQKRPAYALSTEDVHPGLRIFLDAVANFFTRPVNLERQSQAVAQSTFLKARERMLCKSKSE